jgi:serine/threonine-protein kinase
VWLGHGLSSSGKVAIKVLDLNGMFTRLQEKRFKREIGIVSSLDHPNICGVHDKGQTEDGLYFFVMPMLRGNTLGNVLKRKRLDLESVIDIISQVLLGLAAAHGEDVVHRDIKPSNIFVTRAIPGRSDGKVKLLDFGVSKILGNSAKLTDTGVSLGTVHYMSPEQIIGRKTDHRSDIYSVGVVLYEMVTGTRPHVGDTPEEVRKKIDRSVPFKTPRQVDPSIPSVMERIILKAMSRVPEDRYQSAVEMIGALENAAKTPRQSMAEMPLTKDTRELVSESPLFFDHATLKNRD